MKQTFLHVSRSMLISLQFELPTYLMTEDQMVAWCTLFIRVVSKVPPASLMPEDLEEREQNHWWKAKKWAYANLNRLFVRYDSSLKYGKCPA